MITDIEDYFRQGCGRCERFATADCATQQWQVFIEQGASIEIIPMLVHLAVPQQM